MNHSTTQYKVPISSSHGISKLMTSSDVMKLLNYQSKSTFWSAVHKFGIPYIRINSKHCMFEQSVLQDWLKSKAVGSLNNNI